MDTRARHIQLQEEELECQQTQIKVQALLSAAHAALDCAAGISKLEDIR